MRVAVDEAVVEDHRCKHLAHLQTQAKVLVLRTGRRIKSEVGGFAFLTL
jgi:hypothetical protein